MLQGILCLTRFVTLCFFSLKQTLLFYAVSICTAYAFFYEFSLFCDASCIFLDQVKEDIFLAYENHMKNEDLNTCIKAKGLLLDTIRIITNASGESGDTVKVGSTGSELNASQ